MQLTCECVLALPGLGDMQGICHVRAFEKPGRRPVVIVGERNDNSGTYIPNGVEMLAHTIHQQRCPYGREFQLMQRRPPDEFRHLGHDGEDHDGNAVPPFRLLVVIASGSDFRLGSERWGHLQRDRRLTTRLIACFLG
ncbi:MAG: hypothetical protein M0T77_07510 [Actinomycetota bacterium]|nr:hypothetical protein [Actinomycetota bacterium]